MSTYMAASRLDDALSILVGHAGSGGPAVRILAGGTDLYPADAAGAAWLARNTLPVLDVSRIAGMAGISRSEGGWRLGALTTWSAIASAPLPGAFDALRAAARQVGGAQIQNRGTLGGNLCNASPAADGVPPLLALAASVELASASGTRRLPLQEFIRGNRMTALRPDELLTAIHVPEPPPDEASVFLKLGARSYLVISIASVAANVRLDKDGRIALLRLAVGSCSAAPLRLSRLEQELVGRLPHAAEVTLLPGDGISPIDDVRASKAYRLAAAGTLVRRAVQGFAAPARTAA